MKQQRSFFLGTVGGAFAGVTLLRYPGEAAEFSFKLANDDALTHPLSLRAAAAAEKITQQTNGRVQFQFFPNSQLGSTTSLLSQLRLGVIDFVQLPIGIMANVVPLCNIDFVPFAFPTYQDAWKARDGAFGNFIRTTIQRSTNLHVFDKAWDNGFRDVFNNIRPINAPSDVKGLKLRVPSISILVDLFKGLGALPTSININEEYTALQSHLADGGEQDLFVIQVQKFYEVTKYISLTRHVSSGYGLFATPNAWQRLPANLREVIDGTFNEAAILERNDLASFDEPSRAKLKEEGMIINSVDTASFKAAIRRAGLYAQWRRTFGSEAWGLLEKYSGPLT